MSEEQAVESGTLPAPAGSVPSSPTERARKAYRLTRKEAAFLGLYTNPAARNPRTGKRTFRNGTQAASAVYDAAKLTTAASIASENLKKPHIQAALDTLFNASGLDDTAAANVIADIALGTAERVTTFEILDTKGNVRELRARKRPNFADSIRAVKLRYDLTGRTAFNEAQGRAASKVLTDLMKRHAPKKPGAAGTSSESEPEAADEVLS